MAEVSEDLSSEEAEGGEQEHVAEEARAHEGEEENRRLCDAFLDRFAGLMDHTSVKTILEEQEHM